MQAGTTVRFTRGPLGLIATPTSGRFEVPTVSVGDEGAYHSPHTALGEKGWHMIQVGELYCPCHESQFEEVPINRYRQGGAPGGRQRDWEPGIPTGLGDVDE